jgi:hypothetical protein
MYGFCSQECRDIPQRICKACGIRSAVKGMYGFCSQECRNTPSAKRTWYSGRRGTQAKRKRIQGRRGVDASDEEEEHEQEQNFRVGEKIDAKWEGDGSWYDAEIIDSTISAEDSLVPQKCAGYIASITKYHVRFTFDGLMQWTACAGLRPSAS